MKTKKRMINSSLYFFFDHEGAQLFGSDGAKPGFWVKGQLVVGEGYRQEYYEGKAEDMGKTVSVDEAISVRYGLFSDCVKIFE